MTDLESTMETKRAVAAHAKHLVSEIMKVCAMRPFADVLFARERGRTGIFYGELSVPEAEAWIESVNTGSPSMLPLQFIPSASDGGVVQVNERHADFVKDAHERNRVCVCIRICEPFMFGRYYPSAKTETYYGAHFASIGAFVELKSTGNDVEVDDPSSSNQQQAATNPTVYNQQQAVDNDYMPRLETKL